MSDIITNEGRAIINARLAVRSGGAGSHPLAGLLSWGTGAGRSRENDTGLFSESKDPRARGALQKVGNIYIVLAILKATEERAITNLGLFTATGELLMKADFPAVQLLEGDGCIARFSLEVVDQLMVIQSSRSFTYLERYPSLARGRLRRSQLA